MKFDIIVSMRYIRNTTRKGNPSATPATRAFRYNTWEKGHGQEETARGQWIDENGQAVPHTEVQQWVRTQARQQKYTYHFVLSMQNAPASATEFQQAMRHGFEQTGEFGEFRLITHDNTDHAHAHVLAFRDKTLWGAEREQWQAAVQAPLLELEQAYFEQRRTLALEQQQAYAQSRSADSGLDY